MADEQHVVILTQGVSVWNQWRMDNPEIRPDLCDISFRGVSPSMLGIDLSRANFREVAFEGADLYRSWLVETDFSGAELRDAVFGQATLGGAKFAGANLQDANFMQAHLFEADFTKADLSGAKFYGAFLEKANLRGQKLVDQWLAEANLKDADLHRADLSSANLQGANLQGADLSEAVLCNADLQGARLIETNVEGADFESALVRGISVWSLKGKPKRQNGLVLSRPSEAQVTVDDLEVAQFIYLLLRREKLRNVIDTITSKAVLILGRFTPERKVVLDTIADELRKYNLLPIVFDFEGSTSRDFTETIKILAGMSFFVIADITNPKSAPLELQATVPDYRIPFLPIIQEDEDPFSMFSDLRGKYDWVLEPLRYPSLDKLIQVFKKAIIDRAWDKHQTLQKRKVEEDEGLSVDDFLDEEKGLAGQ